jgi:ribonuclease E
MGVRCEVISFRGNTSSDLIEVADQFTDIVQLARVEKGSRSGRRVAEDDADLSMTEVPDKLTEGTGSGRGGRSRSRSRFRDDEPASSGVRGRRGRGAAAAAPARAEAGTALVALPGERLARAGGLTEADLASAEVFTLDDLEASAGGGVAESGELSESGQLPEGEGGEPRRRRRRGGRGRGRGRGRAEESQLGQEALPEHREAVEPGPRTRGLQERPVHDEEDSVAPRRAPRSTPFGSVWDSQLGTPVAPAAASLAPLPDDEEFDEPEIPEYLIAEQRRGGNRGGGRGGPRGGRSAYQSAMERERYGRGGGGGINRYPDVSGRTRQPEPHREERGYGRADRTPPPPPRTSNEPWSDVPPELEAMLRAQVALKPLPRPASSPVPPPERGAEPSTDAAGTARAARARVTRQPSTRTSRGAQPSRAVAPEAPVAEVPVAESAVAPTAAPKRRVGRPSKTPTVTIDAPEASMTADLAPAAAQARPRATRTPATAGARSTTVAKTVGARRGSRAAATSDAAPDAAPGTGTDAEPAARRRTTRKTTISDPA